jgi:hypothetical protein
VQSLAGPREVRTGIIGCLLRRVIEISLVAGPIALLVLFQLQFLPYHSEWITNWQRIAVVIDLVLLWVLWPRIAREKTAWLGRRDFKQFKVQALLLASVLSVLLVVTIATFPGEWLEDHLHSLPIVPTRWPTEVFADDIPQGTATVGGFDTLAVDVNSRTAAALKLTEWETPHQLLVAGQVNYVTGTPQSLWSNRLVLPNFEVGDRVKFDAEGKIAISSDNVSLRGRSLEGIVFVGAHLRKADFTGAQLAGADFTRADLRDAKFECDRVGYQPKWIVSRDVV